VADPLLLAVDQGTSGTKVAVFDVAGKLRAQGHAALASSYPSPGFVEQSPEAIFNSVIEAVGRAIEALKGSGGDAASIAACGISNQRETFLLWDRQGRPLTPAIGWQCKRSIGICERLRAEGIAEEVRSRTGLFLDPYFSATKLLWLLENDSDLRAAVHAGTVRFGTVDTWLLWLLTGGSSYATDHTNASRTLLFNLDTMSWDPWLRARWGLDALVLPAVHPSAFPYGETDFRGILPRPVTVAAMIGDSQSAAFGEGCTVPGTAKATMGTGSSILMDVGASRVDSRAGVVATICWSIPGRIDHALEGIIVSCGATIDWMRDQLGLFQRSEETGTLALSVADNGGVSVVPAFSGMGAPWWRMDARGTICGLTLASTRGHVVRAALESISFQIADIIALMEAETHQPLTELKADGGITRNRFVMQLLADALGVPVVGSSLPEVSARGAALLAGLGAGVYRDVQDLAGLFTAGTRFLPGNGHAKALEDHEEWKREVAKHL
jgi:glycerol kinase